MPRAGNDTEFDAILKSNGINERRHASARWLAHQKNNGHNPPPKFASKSEEIKEKLAKHLSLNKEAIIDTAISGLRKNTVLKEHTIFFFHHTCNLDFVKELEGVLLECSNSLVEALDGATTTTLKKHADLT